MPTWPNDHSAKHAAAARKGWGRLRTRREAVNQLHLHRRMPDRSVFGVREIARAQRIAAGWLPRELR